MFYREINSWTLYWFWCFLCNTLKGEKDCLVVTLSLRCVSNLLLWEHKITCAVCHSMYSKELEMTSVEKAITSPAAKKGM